MSVQPPVSQSPVPFPADVHSIPRRPLCLFQAPSPGPAPGPSGPAASSGAGGREDALFQRLCAEGGVVTAVGLRPIPGPSVRGLVALRPVPAGDVVLKIPLEHCLREPRFLPPELVEEIGGVPDSFTWDIRLGIKVLEAVKGRESALWSGYAQLLPRPETVACPMLLPPALLTELQHPSMAAAAEAQQERLRDLFPDMVPPADAPPEMFPSPLMWAWAMVRSRGFAAGSEAFAFVPFLDMANHADIPSCNFEYAPADGCFYLRALRALPPGAEATISYGEGYDNQRLFAQYGFVEPGGNPQDRLPGLEGLASEGVALSRARLQDTLREKGVDVADLDAMQPGVRATLDSLPLTEDAALPVAAELQAVARLQATLEAVSKADFTTPMQEDVELAQRLLTEEREGKGGDPRLVALVLYRVERKYLVNVARSILEDHKAALEALQG